MTRTKPWPPREDRRIRRERTVTNANRVNTYGLTDATQARLRNLILEIVEAEPSHADDEVRYRHIGAEIARKLVIAACISDAPAPWAIAIIDGVLATELRRHAKRIWLDEHNQADGPRKQPAQQSLI